jgi:hypothetical protein
MSKTSASLDVRKTDHEFEWDRSERRSTRIALAIALIPIPIALVISWSLGSPPWLSRPDPGPEALSVPIAPGHDSPGHSIH